MLDIKSALKELESVADLQQLDTLFQTYLGKK
jgi:hypothetical protein